MKCLLTILSVLIVANLNAQCAQPQNVYEFNYDGHTYKAVREVSTWEDAAACAVGNGGYLAEINDANEQSAIFNELNTNASIIVGNTIAPDGGGASYIWIGGNDIASEGDWIWDGDNNSTGAQFWQGTSTGNPVGGLYNNWGNEPDDFGTGQDGLGLALTDWPLGVAGQWNDVDHTNNLYFLIEIDNVGLENLKLDQSIKVYPNPAEDYININNTTEESFSICITDLSGKTLIESSAHVGQTTLDTRNLPAGTYLLEYLDDVVRIVLK